MSQFLRYITWFKSQYLPFNGENLGLDQTINKQTKWQDIHCLLSLSCLVNMIFLMIKIPWNKVFSMHPFDPNYKMPYSSWRKPFFFSQFEGFEFGSLAWKSVKWRGKRRVSFFSPLFFCRFLCRCMGFGCIKLFMIWIELKFWFEIISEIKIWDKNNTLQKIVDYFIIVAKIL